MNPQFALKGRPDVSLSTKCDARATVIIGLGILGWMILQFSGNVARLWGPETILVRFVTDRADGVADGSPILYRGVDSGHVTRVWIDEADTGDASSSRRRSTASRRYPATCSGVIRTASLLGAGSAVSLEIIGVPSDTTPEGRPNRRSEVRRAGRYPPLRIRRLRHRADAQPSRNSANRASSRTSTRQVTNVGELIDSMREIVGDPNTQADLKTTFANLREVTDSAKQIAGKLDKFADELQKTSTKPANDDDDPLARATTSNRSRVRWAIASRKSPG